MTNETVLTVGADAVVRAIVPNGDPSSLDPYRELARELLLTLARLGKSHAENVVDHIDDDRTIGERAGTRASLALRDWWEAMNGEDL